MGQVTREEMLDRVAHFSELTPSPQAFLDTRLPGHERDIFNVIGAGVTEDADLAPAIADARDFNLTYVGAEPGNGAALHDHPTVEVFIPIGGTWTFFWGDEGEESVELGHMDVISIPPGVMRGFRNTGSAYAHIITILGGTNAGKVSWSKSVIDDAKASGLELDAAGNIVELAE